jgi:hypothetical protein
MVLPACGKTELSPWARHGADLDEQTEALRLRWYPFSGLPGNRVVT